MACCTVRCACSAAARLKRAWAPSCGLTMPWNRPAGLPEAFRRRGLGAVDQRCCASPVRPARRRWHSRPGRRRRSARGARGPARAVAARRRGVKRGRYTARSSAAVGLRLEAGAGQCRAQRRRRPAAGPRRRQPCQALARRCGARCGSAEPSNSSIRNTSTCACSSGSQPAAGPRPAAAARGRRRRPGGAGCVSAAATGAAISGAGGLQGRHRAGRA